MSIINLNKENTEKWENKAVLLDRDGVLNEDFGYVYKIEDLKLIPGVIKALKLLKGFKLIIITSQSGIGRGYYTEKDMHRFNKELTRRLKEKGIEIMDIYFCPHHPEKGIGKYKVDCDCRKPKTGMIMRAKEEHNLNLLESIVIGDKTADIEMGKRAGCKTVLVRTGKAGNDNDYDVKPDYIANDLLDAVGWIIENIY